MKRRVASIIVGAALIVVAELRALQAALYRARRKRVGQDLANTIATILVEKTRFQSKIYSTVLNPDQHTKADELQKKWESRLDRFADHFATQSTEK